MPANKFALLRYRIIDKCLTNKGKPFPSREDLRQACEEALYGSGSDAISLSTIDKDIWAMKNEGELGYHAPIEYNRAQKGYFYADSNYTISELSLSDDDLEAIRFAAATLDQFKHVPIFRQYENAIEKIFHRVNISARPDDERLEKFVQFEKSTVSRGNEWLGPLLEHIRNHESVRIAYRKFTDEVLREYELHPYLLKEYQNRWYLIAREASGKGIRTFGLERIDKLEKAERTFTPDAGFRPELIFEHSIGITEKQESPQRVLLRCSIPVGKFLSTQPIHSTQEVVAQNDASITLALNVLLTEELYALVLGYGVQVEALEPIDFRKEIARRLAASAALYQ